MPTEFKCIKVTRRSIDEEYDMLTLTLEEVKYPETDLLN